MQTNKREKKGHEIEQYKLSAKCVEAIRQEENRTESKVYVDVGEECYS